MSLAAGALKEVLGSVSVLLGERSRAGGKRFGNSCPVRRWSIEQTAEVRASGSHLRSVHPPTKVDLLKKSTRDRQNSKRVCKAQGGGAEGGENGWQYLKVTLDTSPFS